MKDYSWGDAQLVKWYAYDGKLTEGVLYTPENLDPNKKYPMLVVFYETNSEELYRHYVMEPSWSWVNYPFYVSRGYVVFVPDVHYTPGIPGEGAYNSICSGVEYLVDKYSFIDKDRIGIDGPELGWLPDGVSHHPYRHVRVCRQRRACQQHDLRLRRHPLGYGDSRSGPV